MANDKIILVLLAFGIFNTPLAQPSETMLLSAHSNKTVNAEEKPGEKNVYITDKDYWQGYISDTKSIITSPSRWEKSDWLTATLVMGTTLCLYVFDEDVRDFVQDNRSNTSDDIASFMKVFGDYRYILPPLGIFYIYGHHTKNKRALRTALLGLESFVISSAFTLVIKFSGHRHKPNSGDSPRKWDGSGLSTSNLSFPSGHSQTAFSIATVIASEYNEYRFIPPLAYGAATLCSLSRVNDDEHWASDVFFGSALGYFTAKAIIRFHDNKKGGNLTLLPIIDNSKTGLLITYKF